MCCFFKCQKCLFFDCPANESLCQTFSSSIQIIVLESTHQKPCFPSMSCCLFRTVMLVFLLLQRSKSVPENTATPSWTQTFHLHSPENIMTWKNIPVMMISCSLHLHSWDIWHFANASAIISHSPLPKNRSFDSLLLKERSDLSVANLVNYYER